MIDARDLAWAAVRLPLALLAASLLVAGIVLAVVC